MFNSLLQNNKLAKIKIWYYFYEHPLDKIQTQKLAAILNISENNLKRYIKELNEDISYIITQSTPMIKKYSPNTYYLGDELKEKELLHSQLIEDYLNSSNGYRLILLFFKKTILSIHTISSELLLSRSVTYDTIKELNHLLVSYNIQITKKNNNLYQFTGEELNIRIFMYNFLTNCTPKKVWPFNFSKLKINHLIFNKTIMNTAPKKVVHDFILLNAIIFNRVSQGYYLHSSHYSFDVSENTLFCSDSIKNIYIEHYIRDSKIKKNEQDMLIFLTYIIFPEIIGMANILNFSKNSEHVNQCTTLFYQELLQLLCLRFDLDFSTEQYHFSRYYLYLHHKLYLLLPSVDPFHLIELDQDVPLGLSFRNNLPWKKSRFDESKKIYFELIQKERYQEFSSLPSNHLMYMSFVTTNLSFLFKREQIKPITIYFDFGKDYLSKKIIQNKLSSIYCSKVLTISTSEKKADIILTNHFMTATSSSRLYIKDVFDIEYIHKLLYVINKKILSHRFQPKKK